MVCTARRKAGTFLMSIIKEEIKAAMRRKIRMRLRGLLKKSVSAIRIFVAGGRSALNSLNKFSIFGNMEVIIKIPTPTIAMIITAG